MRRVTLIHLINVRGCRMFSLPWSIEGFGLSKIYMTEVEEKCHIEFTQHKQYRYCAVQVTIMSRFTPLLYITLLLSDNGSKAPDQSEQ